MQRSNTSVIDKVFCFQSILGNFTCLAVVFNLKRRLGYHLFHTYIPSALIVVMSWISFWIKPEAIPARITLGEFVFPVRKQISTDSTPQVWLLCWLSPLRIPSHSKAYRRCLMSKPLTFGWARAPSSCSCRWWSSPSSTSTWVRWQPNRWRATRTKTSSQKKSSETPPTIDLHYRNTIRFVTEGKSRCLSIECRDFSFHFRFSF